MMLWILLCVGVAVISSWLFAGGDDLDYRAREIRAAMARRDAEQLAEMHRIQRAQRRRDLRESVRWARATPTVARA